MEINRVKETGPFKGNPITLVMLSFDSLIALFANPAIEQATAFDAAHPGTYPVSAIQRVCLCLCLCLRVFVYV